MFSKHRTTTQFWEEEPDRGTEPLTQPRPPRLGDTGRGGDTDLHAELLHGFLQLLVLLPLCGERRGQGLGSCSPSPRGQGDHSTPTRHHSSSLCFCDSAEHWVRHSRSMRRSCFTASACMAVPACREPAGCEGPTSPSSTRVLPTSSLTRALPRPSLLPSPHRSRPHTDPRPPPRPAAGCGDCGDPLPSPSSLPSGAFRCTAETGQVVGECSPNSCPAAPRFSPRCSPASRAAPFIPTGAPVSQAQGDITMTRPPVPTVTRPSPPWGWRQELMWGPATGTRQTGHHSQHPLVAHSRERPRALRVGVSPRGLPVPWPSGCHSSPAQEQAGARLLLELLLL